MNQYVLQDRSWKFVRPCKRSRFTSSSGDLFHFGLLELLDSFPMASVIFVLTEKRKDYDIVLFYTNKLAYVLPLLRPPPPYLSRLCRLFLNLLPLPLKSKCIIYSNLPKCIPTHNYIICFDWNSHLCSFQSLQFFDDLHISLFSCRILFTRSDSSLLRIIFPALPRSSTTLLRMEENAVEKGFG